MKKSFLLLLPALSLVWGLSSCKRDLQRPSWDIGVVGPVIHSSLGLGNMIADSLLQVNPDSSVVLSFSGAVYELDADTLLKLPDTTITNSFSLPTIIPSVNVTPGQLVFNQTENRYFNGQGVQLTIADLRSGGCYLTLSSTINQPVDFTYEILTAFKSGQHFITTSRIPPGSITQPSQVVVYVDLSGYRFILTDASATQFNQYTTKTTIKMSADAQPTTVTNQDIVAVSSTFSGLEPSYAKGYFGSRIESFVNEPSNFSSFEKIISGVLDIDQVNVNLTFTNYIGADARITLQSLKAARGADTVVLAHSVIGSAININRATDPGGIVVPSTYSVNLNNGNSNIDQIIELLPLAFSSSLDFHINPLGNVAAHHDFFYAPKTVKADLNFTLPLNIIANNLTLADTIDLNLERGENGHIRSGKLHIDISNGFPLAADFQLFFMNGSGTITDSIVQPNSILAAYTNAQNIVTANRDSELIITVNESQMDRLYNGERLVLRIAFSTSSLTQHVTLYDYYRIHVRMRGDFNYRIGS